jgi:hypothetical protein
MKGDRAERDGSVEFSSLSRYSAGPRRAKARCVSRDQSHLAPLDLSSSGRASRLHLPPQGGKAQATSASSSMSPEQSSNPLPPVAGCSPGDGERAAGRDFAGDRSLVERTFGAQRNAGGDGRRDSVLSTAPAERGVRRRSFRFLMGRDASLIDVASANREGRIGWREIERQRGAAGWAASGALPRRAPRNKRANSLPVIASSHRPPADPEG